MCKTRVYFLSARNIIVGCDIRGNLNLYHPPGLEFLENMFSTLSTSPCETNLHACVKGRPMQQGSKNPWFDFEELQKEAKVQNSGEVRRKDMPQCLFIMEVTHGYTKCQAFDGVL